MGGSCPCGEDETNPIIPPTGGTAVQIFPPPDQWEEINTAVFRPEPRVGGPALVGLPFHSAVWPSSSLRNFSGSPSRTDIIVSPLLAGESDSISYEVSAKCRCILMGIDGDIEKCPALDSENHECRCYFLFPSTHGLTPRRPLRCLSKQHWCLCKSIDKNVVCRRHMIEVRFDNPEDFRLSSPSACSICLSTLKHSDISCISLQVRDASNLDKMSPSSPSNVELEKNATVILESIARPPVVIVCLKTCGHCYHCSCIKTWFGNGKYFCPLCMRRISSRTAQGITIPHQREDIRRVGWS